MRGLRGRGPKRCCVPRAASFRCRQKSRVTLAKAARSRLRMDSSWSSPVNLKADSSESASVARNLAAVERRAGNGEIAAMIDVPSLKMGRRANLWENLAVRANFTR